MSIDQNSNFDCCKINLRKILSYIMNVLHIYQIPNIIEMVVSR